MAYFPRSKHCLSSLGLLGYNLPSLFVVSIVSRYYSFYGLLIIKPNIWAVIYIFIVTLSYYLSFCYLHFWLWGKPDPNPQHLKWLPSNQSLIKGIEMTIISIISYSIMAIILLPFSDSHKQEWFILVGFCSWIVIASSLYFFQSLIANKK